ncbi:hypothetical protein WJ972_09265 [Achromobacter insuavis]
MSDFLASLAEVDDCWNRIGSRGDKRCERLPEYVHCRNCPVYAGAAKRILDRLPPQIAAPVDGAARRSRRGSRRCWCSGCRANGWACRPRRWTRWPAPAPSCRCRTGAIRRCWA